MKTLPIILLAVTLLSGCPKSYDQADLERNTRAAENWNQTAFELQPLAPGQWFQLSVGDYLGVQKVSYIVNGETHVALAQSVKFAANPGVTQGTIKWLDKDHAVLTYPYPEANFR